MTQSISLSILDTLLFGLNRRKIHYGGEYQGWIWVGASCDKLNCDKLKVKYKN